MNPEVTSYPPSAAADGPAAFSRAERNFDGIGTYDVTSNQYVEFLNAKDPTGANPLGIFESAMTDATWGGVTFTPGNPNGSKYSAVANRGNHPVKYVTFYDALRFANWLNNGQGNGDTESGAYTLLGGTHTPSNGPSIVRNPGASVFLPSENEWYTIRPAARISNIEPPATRHVRQQIHREAPIRRTTTVPWANLPMLALTSSRPARTARSTKGATLRNGTNPDFRP